MPDSYAKIRIAKLSDSNLSKVEPSNYKLSGGR